MNRNPLHSSRRTFLGNLATGFSGIALSSLFYQEGLFAEQKETSGANARTKHLRPVEWRSEKSASVRFLTGSHWSELSGTS